VAYFNFYEHIRTKNFNKMKLKSTLVLVLTIIVGGQMAKSQDLTGWSADTLELANTAKSLAYLTAEEKKVFQLINLARISGKSFVERVAKPYVQKNNIDPDEFVTSLYQDLQNASGLQVINPLEKLHESAAFHANDMGHKGLFGHESSDGTLHLTRIHRYHKREKMGESLCYGYNEAVDIVMQLLLDEAIELRTNRQHILHQNFHHAGVSIKPHKVYEFNCVIDFSSL
jgi:uncharacterized protein YkwD